MDLEFPAVDTAGHIGIDHPDDIPPVFFAVPDVQEFLVYFDDMSFEPEFILVLQSDQRQNCIPGDRAFQNKNIYYCFSTNIRKMDFNT
jgi:hypothetical protein